MEEEGKFDRTLLSGNKERFSFTMSHKKTLGYVWSGCDRSSLQRRAITGPSAPPPLVPIQRAGAGFIVRGFSLFFFSSKSLKPQSNSSVFGSLQNLKEDKSKPVRDEYEYVSDEGELKIDEFPIRRKKNAVKRDLSCECQTLFCVAA